MSYFITLSSWLESELLKQTDPHEHLCLSLLRTLQQPDLNKRRPTNKVHII